MQACEIPLQVLSPTSLQSLDKLIKQAQERTARAMDGTNHSRGSTIQSLSPDKREHLEHELRPEALASIAREEDAEASTNTTHAAVSPKPRAETASTGLVP